MSPSRLRLPYLCVVALVLTTIAGLCASIKKKAPLKAAPEAPGYSGHLPLAWGWIKGDYQFAFSRIKVPDSVLETKGIVYKKKGKRRLKLDLYKPAENSAKPAPAIIFIHGGGWVRGFRGMKQRYAVEFAERGYVTATISYGLAPASTWPEPLDDVREAVRWIRRHAGKLHIDPEKIALVGGSAGGHLAMLAAYTGNDGKAAKRKKKHVVSDHVCAVVTVYGVYDLTTKVMRKALPARMFLGNTTFRKKPERFRQASPKFHLDKHDPPTLILHGTIDPVVSISQADALADDLQKLKIPHVYDRMTGWTHGLDFLDKPHARCVHLMEVFFEKHLLK